MSYLMCHSNIQWKIAFKKIVEENKKHKTCFSSSDGEDIAGFTGAQTVLSKHADVVS